MECWVEYYSELYGRSSSVLPSVLDCIERLPIMFELDEPLTKEDLSKVISHKSSGKVPGLDGIPLKSSNAVETNCSTISTSCSANAGKRDTFPRR